MKRTIIVGTLLILIIVTGSIILFTHPPMDTSRSSDVLMVDIASLITGGEICVMAQPLNAGDTIIYDLNAEGNGNLQVEFRKTDEESDQEGYFGSSKTTRESYIKGSFSVPSELAGTYYLWVSNYTGDTLTNITGTVTITPNSDAKIEEENDER